MSVMMQCRECGREMHSTGMRGLCPACLFSCTTIKFQGEPSAHLEEDDALEYGTAVGPANRFLLLDKLGEGGMGEVWLADDRELSQDGEAHLVALKFLSARIRGNRRAVAMVRTEVLRTQALAHPNIVRVFDLHTTRKGVPFIKMEYVEGNSLSVWLQDRPGQVMPWPKVVQVAHELAAALQYAHETALVVHRDIKPGNMLMKNGLTLKLSDFGIAQAMFLPESRREVALGTLSYASPQQLLGAPPNPSDDIYAMGATLYELLTGHPPFAGNTPEEIIEQVRFHEPASIHANPSGDAAAPPIPKKLADLVYRCLQKDPQKRPHAREIPSLLPSPRHENLAVDSRKWAELDAEIQRAPESGIGVYAALTALVILSLLAWFNWGAIKTIVAKVIGSEERSEEPKDPEGPEFPPPPPPPTIIDPPKIETGIIVLNLERSHRFRFQLFQDGKQLLSSNVTRGAHVIRNLTVGDYTVRVENDEKWPLTKHLTILTGVTRVSFTYEWSRIELTSTPPGAWISWPENAVGSGEPFTGTTPATPYMRHGQVQFDLSYNGYLPLRQVVEISGPSKHHFTLTKSKAPIFGSGAAPIWSHTNGLEFVYFNRPPLPPLYVSAKEVRVADFRAFAAAQPKDAFAGMHSVTPERGPWPAGRSWDAPGWEQSDEHPVVGVSWFDCANFAGWLTEKHQAEGVLKSSQFYALPSTNEWFSFAGDTVYPWGNHHSEFPGQPLQNYSGRELLNDRDWPRSWPILHAYEDGYRRTGPVGALGRNVHGLFHIGGNVAEWCQEKALCGASWADGEATAAAENWDRLKIKHVRTAYDPGRRDDRFGFRLVIREERMR